MIIDLKRTDQYENYIVPDEDVEITLKVLRTIRNMCLDKACFYDSILLSEAHKRIIEITEECIIGN